MQLGASIPFVDCPMHWQWVQEASGISPFQHLHTMFVREGPFLSEGSGKQTARLAHSNPSVSALKMLPSLSSLCDSSRQNRIPIYSEIWGCNKYYFHSSVDYPFTIRLSILAARSNNNPTSIQPSFRLPKLNHEPIHSGSVISKPNPRINTTVISE